MESVPTTSTLVAHARFRRPFDSVARKRRLVSHFPRVTTSYFANMPGRNGAQGAFLFAIYSPCPFPALPLPMVRGRGQFCATQYGRGEGGRTLRVSQRHGASGKKKEGVYSSDMRTSGRVRVRGRGCPSDRYIQRRKTRGRFVYPRDTEAPLCCAIISIQWRLSNAVRSFFFHLRVPRTL